MHQLCQPVEEKGKLFHSMFLHRLPREASLVLVEDHTSQIQALAARADYLMVHHNSVSSMAAPVQLANDPVVAAATTGGRPQQQQQKKKPFHRLPRGKPKKEPRPSICYNTGHTGKTATPPLAGSWETRELGAAQGCHRRAADHHQRSTNV